MRRELVVFAVILAIVLAVGFFGRTLLMHIALTQLKSAFPGYKVSIGSVEIRTIDMIAVSNIEVKKGNNQRYRIRSVEINFSPLSLFTKIIPKVTVKDASFQISVPDKKLKDLIEYPTPKPGKGFIVKSVQLSDIMVYLKTTDWRLEAVAYGDITMGKDTAYSATIKLNSIDLAFLVKAFDAGDKIDLKGGVTGDLSLNGKNLRITEIKGDFLIIPPGGKLVIKDEDFLKKQAENTKQPLEVIEAGFKNYDFTKGTLQLSRNSESILLHILLDGDSGKRDLTVALHGY